MMIPALSHREIGHSNIQFISLLAMYLDIRILSTIWRWVPVCVPLRTVLHIATCFTTAVTVAGDCNLLRISTSTTPDAPTTAAFWWMWSSLGGSRQVRIHISGYSMTRHGLKRNRLSREVSLISSGKSRFSSRCIRPSVRGPEVSINKLLVLGLSFKNNESNSKQSASRIRENAMCCLLKRNSDATLF